MTLVTIYRQNLLNIIGEWHEDGTLAVIDRKKNLIKLSHGEYIAVEKLEAKYHNSPFVENICVYADGLRYLFFHDNIEVEVSILLPL